MKIVSDFPHEYLYLPELPLGLEIVVKFSEYRVSNNLGLAFRRFHEHGILVNHIGKTGTDSSSRGVGKGFQVEVFLTPEMVTDTAQFQASLVGDHSGTDPVIAMGGE